MFLSLIISRSCIRYDLSQHRETKLPTHFSINPVFIIIMIIIMVIILVNFLFRKIHEWCGRSWSQSSLSFVSSSKHCRCVSTQMITDKETILPWVLFSLLIPFVSNILCWKNKHTHKQAHKHIQAQVQEHQQIEIVNNQYYYHHFFIVVVVVIDIVINKINQYIQIQNIKRSPVLVSRSPPLFPKKHTHTYTYTHYSLYLCNNINGLTRWYVFRERNRTPKKKNSILFCVGSAVPRNSFGDLLIEERIIVTNFERDFFVRLRCPRYTVQILWQSWLHASNKYVERCSTFDHHAKACGLPFLLLLQIRPGPYVSSSQS